MALGKSNARIKSHFGDNGYLKFGSGSGTWQQFGKSNLWALKYQVGKQNTVMADNSTVHIRNVTAAMLELNLAQVHPEEVGLIDDLIASEAAVAFWGEVTTIGAAKIEIYIPELIFGTDMNLETPSSDNIKVALDGGVQPQTAIVSGTGATLPTASNQGSAVAFTGKNKYFAYFVSAAT